MILSFILRNWKKTDFREENEFFGEIYQKMDACFHCDPPPHQKSP